MLIECCYVSVHVNAVFALTSALCLQCFSDTYLKISSLGFDSDLCSLLQDAIRMCGVED